MKQCPSCKTTYTDDTLSFCLADGSGLTSLTDEEPTVVRASGADRARVNIGRPADPRSTTPERTGSSAGWLKIAVAAAVVGLLLLIGLGVAGFGLYYGTGRLTADNNNTPVSPTPSPSPTQTPDKEKERLRDELANIQRQLDEQKRGSKSDNPETDDHAAVTATVNSPNDGFLALRSQPDADRGERIARIPHGAEVEVLRCGGGTVTIGSRQGKWCYVEYDGQTGWVFDAWLTY